MQYTTNYQLKKPEDSEVFDQQNHANYNYVIIDQTMKSIEEKADNAPADSVNDDAIGNRTPDQTQVPVSPGTGKLGQLVSWLANRIKTITGKANWWDAPAKSIQQLSDEQASHSANHLNIVLAPTPPANPNTNTYWYDDLGESIELGGGGGLLIGNAGMDSDKDIWFDENI